MTARRSGMRIAVLALLFAAGLLCAICSGPPASADSGGGARGPAPAPSAVTAQAPADSPHSYDDGHGHDCQSASGLGAATEQRTAAVKMFAFTALAVSAPVLLSRAPLSVWVARDRRSPLHPGSRLLKTLCVQRV